jgi:hypothetical protein
MLGLVRGDNSLGILDGLYCWRRFCRIALLIDVLLDDSIQAREMQLAFHLHAQRISFRRRDVRPIARWNPPLIRSPNSNRLC